MKRLSLLLAFALTVILNSNGYAQQTQRDRIEEIVFSMDANDTFTQLSDQARIGFMFPQETALRDILERLLARYKMVNVTSLQPQSGWAGAWVRKNTTGSVSLEIRSPALESPTYDHAVVTYNPATEEPIPEAVLSHLLGKAERTKLTSGDTLDLEFPSEVFAPSNRCSSSTTLRIRIGTGALVANRLSTVCNRK